MDNLHTLQLWHLHVPYPLLFALPSLSSLRTFDLRDCRVECYPNTLHVPLQIRAGVTAFTSIDNTYTLSRDLTWKFKEFIDSGRLLGGYEEAEAGEDILVRAHGEGVILGLEKNGLRALYRALLSHRLKRLTTTVEELKGIRRALDEASRGRYMETSTPDVSRLRLEEFRISNAKLPSDDTVYSFLQQHGRYLERFEIFQTTNEGCEDLARSLTEELTNRADRRGMAIDGGQVLTGQNEVEDPIRQSAVRAPTQSRVGQLTMPHLKAYKGPSSLIPPLSGGRMTLRDIRICDWIDTRDPEPQPGQWPIERSEWPLEQVEGMEVDLQGERRRDLVFEEDLSGSSDGRLPFLGMKSRWREIWKGDWGRAKYPDGMDGSEVRDHNGGEEMTPEEGPTGETQSQGESEQEDVIPTPASSSQLFLSENRYRYLYSLRDNSAPSPDSIRAFDKRLDAHLYALFHPVLRRLYMNGLGSLLERLEFTVMRFEANIMEMVISLLPGLTGLEIRCLRRGPEEQFFMSFWGNYLPRLPNLTRVHIYTPSQPSLPSPCNLDPDPDPDSDLEQDSGPGPSPLDSQRSSLRTMSRVQPKLIEFSMSRAIVWTKVQGWTDVETKQGRGWGYWVREPWIGCKGDDPLAAV